MNRFKKNVINFDMDGIKLSEIKSNYFRNGENVTCETTGVVVGPVEFEEYLGSPYKTVKATAKVHPDDEYVDGIGEKVAQAKAESRLYRLQANEVRRRYEHLVDVVEALKPLVNDFLDKADGCIEHNEMYINRITSPEYIEQYKKEQETKSVF